MNEVTTGSKLPESFSVGDLIADRYLVRKILNDREFLAEDRVTAQEVRVVSASKEDLERLRPCVGMAVPPAIVPVLDVFATARGSFYTTPVLQDELLRGLKDRRLRQEQRFSVDEVVSLVSPLVGGMEFLLQRSLRGRITCDTLRVDAGGMNPCETVRISETAIEEARRDAANTAQREIAALMYELLAGSPPTESSRPLDQVRKQIPKSLSATIDRALNSRRPFRSLAAFQRALRGSGKRSGGYESVALSVVVCLLVLIGGYVWWSNQPVPSRHTKADYAQLLGQIEQTQKLAAQQESRILGEAESARNELDKWERELTSARESEKPVQREYAEQRLNELRPTAELQIATGELWKKHRRQQTWQSEGNGLLTAAASLSEEANFDEAVKRLQQARSKFQQVIDWQSNAMETLRKMKDLEGRLRKLEAESLALAYEWPHREIDRIREELTDTEGAASAAAIEKVERALPEITALIGLRAEALKEFEATASLEEIQEIREEREGARKRLHSAETRLKSGEFAVSRQDYEQSVAALKGLPLNALQRLLEGARKSREQQKSDAALTLLNQAFKITAETDEEKAVTAEAYFLRAEIRLDSKDPSGAIEDLSQGLLLAPKSPAALLRRARLSLVSGKPESAIADCNSLLESTPDSLEACRVRGEAALALKQWDSALADLNRCLNDAPADSLLLMKRAGVYAELGQSARGIADYSTVLATNPTDLNALTARAGLLRRSGDHQGALKDSVRLLELQPDSAAGHFYRGASKISLGETEQGLIDLQRSVELKWPGTEIHCIMAQAWNRLGKLSEARQACELALAQDADCVEALYERGKVSQAEGAFKKAQEDFERVLKLDSEHVNALSGRGDVRFQLDELGLSLDDYQAALQINPEHQASLLGRATVYAAQGNFSGAVEDCNRVAKVAPSEVRAFRIRAVAHFKLMHYDQVIEDCTSVLSLSPKEADVYRYRAAAWLEKKEAKKAIADCDAALAINPSLAACYRTRGQAWFQEGEQAKARADYETALKLESQ